MRGDDRARTAAVVIMTKAPRPGLVKTRAHPLLGRHRAAALRAELLERAVGVRLLKPLRDLDTPADAAALLADPALPGPIAALLGAGGAAA